MNNTLQSMFGALLGGWEIILILLGMAVFVVMIAVAVGLALWLARRTKKKVIQPQTPPDHKPSPPLPIPALKPLTIPSTEVITSKCPQCGTPLPSGALAGLCPACLLQMGAAADTVTEGKRPFTPPSVAELALLFPQLEILELIGKGGMGAVYKARQKQLDRIVALKILPPGIGDDAAFAERFTREARALAKLNHPGIVTLYEFGRADLPVSLESEATQQHRPATESHFGSRPSTLDPQPSLYYFLMEFVDGVNLRQLLHAGRVSAREALAIVPQICDALQFAHDQGIVHRDIKPENILLDRRGRVKVADFGLAKIVGGNEPLTPSLSPSDGERVAKPGEGTLVLTDAGKVMGTPQYMSPEQRDNPGEVDHRADIYALGVVFYQMLTGELPGQKIEAPSKKVQIDVRLDEVVLRALEKKPELRYQHASVLKTELETLAANPGQSAASVPKTAAPSGGSVAPVKAGFAAAVTFFYAGVVLSILLIGVLPFRFSRDYAYLLGVGLMLVVTPFGGVAVTNALRQMQASGDNIRWQALAARLKAASMVAWLLALPVIGFAIFFLIALFSERGGWNPAISEAVLVPLTWLGAVLLPLSGKRLWEAAAPGSSGCESVPPEPPSPATISMPSIVWRKLQIVAALFIFSGLWSLLDTLFDNGVGNVTIMAGALLLPLGIGLLNRREFCRRVAVWCVWAGLVFQLIMLGWLFGKAFGLFAGLDVVAKVLGQPMNSAVGAVLTFLLFAGQIILLPWIFLTLMRDEVRSAFAHAQNKPRPFVEWGTLVLVLLVMLGQVRVPFENRLKTGVYFTNLKPAISAPTNGPAFGPLMERVVENPPFVARLPYGGSIELLAVRLHPTTNALWWQPDGSPSGYGPDFEPEGEGQNGSGVVALVKFKQPEKLESWPRPSGTAAEHDTASVGVPIYFATKNGRRLGLNQERALYVEGLPAGDETTLRIKVATAAWQTIASQKPGVLGALTRGRSREGWKFSEAPDGSLSVELVRVEMREDLQYRLVAVDVEGMEHCPSTTRATRTAREVHATYAADFGHATGKPGPTQKLSLRRVREVRWEARPYEYVEFRQVSLQPGHQTTVVVKDFGGGKAAQIAASDFHIGQTYFPKGDSIKITSIERSKTQMTVKGLYNLVSAHEASLWLDFTVANTGEVPNQAASTYNIHISQGWGDFELSRPLPMSGLPHVSMYNNNRSFADIYFGNEAEAAEASKLHLGQDRTPDAAPEQNLSFGPVLERTLPLGDNDGPTQWLNLDTGVGVERPRGWWLTQAVNQAERNTLPGLGFSTNELGLDATAIGLVFLQTLSSSRWDTATAAAVAEEVERLASEHLVNSRSSLGDSMIMAAADAKLPKTYLFKTPKRTIGLLQITGFTENPRGVKIRYKLVQSPAISVVRPPPDEASVSPRLRASLWNLRLPISMDTRDISGPASLLSAGQPVSGTMMADTVVSSGSEGRWQIVSQSDSGYETNFLFVKPQLDGVEVRYSVRAESRNHSIAKAGMLNQGRAKLGCFDIQGEKVFEGGHKQLVAILFEQESSETRKGKSFTNQSPLNFGPVKERTIPIPSALYYRWFDLDAGQPVALSSYFKPGFDPEFKAKNETENRTYQEQLKHLKVESGVDLSSRIEGLPPGFGKPPALLGLEMAVVATRADNWDLMTADALKAALAGVPLKGQPSMEFKDFQNSDPATYLFRTFEGSLGILQIHGWSTSDGLKIRYKLVEAEKN